MVLHRQALVDAHSFADFEFEGALANLGVSMWLGSDVLLIDSLNSDEKI
jgi:hypothetical protein